MRVNLARDRKEGFAINKSYIIMFIIFIVLIAGMYIQYSIMNNRIANYNKQIEIANKDLEELQKKREEYLTLKEKIKSFEEEIAKREESKEEQLPSLTKQNWNITLLELGEIIPEKIMINSLKINNQNLSIRGYGKSSRKISEFLDKLLESELIVNVRLNQLQNGEDVSYDITAEINTENINLDNINLGEEEN